MHPHAARRAKRARKEANRRLNAYCNRAMRDAWEGGYWMYDGDDDEAEAAEVPVVGCLGAEAFEQLKGLHS